jgi:hypothetical protein
MIKFLDKALLLLAPNVRWRITGEQVYENIVWLDSMVSVPTKAEVEQKAQELQDEYESKQYQRDRSEAYPSLAEQLDMQYWDKVNGTTVWADTIAEIKARFPK